MSEMQRVALGRVLIVRPQLLLLDEPMSNLDASIRAALRTELKQIQQELKQSVLYVTHDQVEAMSMSDRIAVMHEGRLLQVGSPHDVYNHPVNRFVAEFIGDPPINIIPCQVERSGDGLVGRTALHSGLSLGRADLDPGDHMLAVRPHDLTVAHTPGPETAESVVRIIENFGSEHVAHLEYGGQLVRVVGRPGFVEPDQRVHLSLPVERAHLIEARSERVVERRSYGAAA
jgi:ABC-type sugar transport system ATPase subunit